MSDIFYLDLYRRPSKEGGTEGELFINGSKTREFWTIEDQSRELEKYTLDVAELLKHKVPGATCIPAGEYEIEYTMSTRFGVMMPLIKNVPGYSGVRIHWGNSSKDLEGCIAVGMTNKHLDDDWIETSKVAYGKLVDILVPIFNKKQPVKIRIHPSAI
jgi:hypothetical protein